MRKKTVESLNCVKNVLETDTTLNLDKTLEKANVTEKQYHQAISFSASGTTVILKCDHMDENTTGYNKDLLMIWKANMDIQFIVDAVSAVMYVCSYMMKSEKGMSDILHNVAKQSNADDIKTQL